MSPATDGAGPASQLPRVRRPRLERTAPVRDYFRTLGPRGSRNANAPASDDVDDTIARSVRSAYEVVDRYVREGQRVASELAAGPYGPLRAGFDAVALAPRLLEDVVEATRAWAELLSALAGAPQRPAATARGDGNSNASPDLAALEAAAERATGERVTVFAVPARPGAAVFSTVPAPRAAGVIRTTEFRAVDSDGPALAPATVTVSGDAAGVTLGIAVPADQPSGVYLGLIEATEAEHRRIVAAMAVHVP